jgi:paired amphipathic helix protein Sin3a
VLNDEWVSHPTWASEEAGFVAHKKNSFEEVIHRCEDERHEYQIQLEGLARTIGILEPLATRLNEMPLGERAQLRLRPDLGGQSRWIYMRTLKKVYGKDAGTEVYQALQEAPAVAVPVVLARLKQKNEEWRRAQREWSHHVAAGRRAQLLQVARPHGYQLQAERQEGDHDQGVRHGDR